MKKNIFTIVTFMILIGFALYAPITSFLEEKGVISGKSVGIQIAEPEIEDGFGATVINRVNSFKHEIDMTYQNYMPFYMETVGMYKNLLRNLNQSFYALYDDINKRNTNKAVVVVDLPDPQVPTSPDDSIIETTPPVNVDIGADKILSYSTIYVGATLRDRYYEITLNLTDGTTVKFLEAVSILTEEQKSIRVQTQISNINRLIRANTDVNVCVYAAVNMEYTDFFKKYITDEKSSKKHLDVFLAGIDKSAQVGYINFSGVLDRVQRCYLTDHHWSTAGSYAGYCDIIDLLRVKAPDILPARAIGTEIVLNPCKFYGSYSRTLAYSQLWDDFIVRDYSLPTHTSTPNYSFYDQIKRIEAKNISGMNNNVYGEFFPEIYTVSYPENNTGHNLMIIGDSYTQGFAELIASSFDNTHCFYWNTYYKLNYNQFIKENNITDVLIMQYGPRIIFNATDDYFLDRINVDPYIEKTEAIN